MCSCSTKGRVSLEKQRRRERQQRRWWAEEKVDRGEGGRGWGTREKGGRVDR